MKKILSIRRCYLIVMILFCTTQISAQNKPVKFERLSSKEGLSQNKIFDIVQDSSGFIWIGTEDGLNRFDGYEFKVFKNIPGDTTSLIDNLIQTLHISKNGVLWSGSQLSGLSKFNSETESFTNYSHDNFNQNTISGNSIIDISEDEKGNLWIATAFSGFNYLDVKSDRFYKMENMLPQDYQIGHENISFIYQDSNNLLWLGGIGRLHVFEVTYPANGSPHLIPYNISSISKISDATQITEDADGKIWIGTYLNGLYSFDYNKQKLEKYKIKGADNLFSKMLIQALALDESNNLWIGGFLSDGRTFNFSFRSGPGLIKIDLETGTLTAYKNDPQNESSLSSNDILSMLIDRTGVLWVGTFLDGINKYDKSLIKFNVSQDNNNLNLNFSELSIRGFFEDDNILWISTGTAGLLAYDKTKKRYNIHKHNPSDENSLSSNLVGALYYDGKYLWIGTTPGLNRFDLKNNTFKRYYLDSTDFSSRFNSINYNIIELDEKPGYLWFGTNGGGLVRFDKKKKTFKNYTYDPETQNSLNNRDNYVRTVFHSPKFPSEIWAGTTHGINILNLETETFRYYEHIPDDSASLSHQNIMQFNEDEDGYIWVSTYGGGLNRFDPETETFRRFTEGNSGLPNNAVYGALSDDEGNLWLSTNNGISKFNRTSFTFKNFTVDDGLQSEEFNGGAYYKNKNGVMYFGGIYGFNSFHPSEVVDNQFIPQIEITDLKIFNESLQIGEDSPLKKQISMTDQVVLSHWQNDISFEFVALHFTNPAKNKYAFKLENYENEWRYVDNIRVATYTNLDPGEYTFKVKGSNSDGLWNEEGKSIKLIISPPWWKTNWAYLSYILFAVLIVFAVDRFQRARLLRIEKEKAQLALLEAENKRKSEELEEARQLQLSMLPKELPQLPHLDIAVYMRTATEVGGDYYDFHIGMDGALTVVLGDATGHGMKAGTMVTTTKSLFNVLAPNPNIVETFHEMTRCLKRMHLEKLSMCMTMIKIMGNKIQMSAAGMPPVLIYKSGSQSIEEHVMKGMPLGTFNDFPYSLVESNISSGDTILMMSDGFPELFNDEKEMYGYQRARNYFKEIAGENPEEIITKLKKTGAEWTNDNDPDDDVTFVVIKVK
ncbi:MAG: SpoIIE family protein phosphatase [Ignavibacteriae bacterium]|nr:hypothetical protein [Ignavibacteriota bacterium]NOG99178.1 SpoIIE family protein phosphatase [Ignavibacteriota bacterium]